MELNKQAFIEARTVAAYATTVGVSANDIYNYLRDSKLSEEWYKDRADYWYNAISSNADELSFVINKITTSQSLQAVSRSTDYPYRTLERIAVEHKLITSQNVTHTVNTLDELNDLVTDEVKELLKKRHKAKEALSKIDNELATFKQEIKDLASYEFCSFDDKHFAVTKSTTLRAASIKLERLIEVLGEDLVKNAFPEAFTPYHSYSVKFK